MGLHWSREQLPWDFLLVMLGGILGFFTVNSLLRRRRARRERPGILREEVLASLRHRYRPSKVGPWGFVIILVFVVLSLLDPLLSFAGVYVPILLLLMVADALVRLLVTDRYARALIGDEPPAGPEPGT